MSSAPEIHGPPDPRIHKKAMAEGGKLRLVKVNNHIFDIFRYSGFDQLFEVERQA